MASGATPNMGKDERYPMSGKIVLFVEESALNISGELKDASAAGFRIAHKCASLTPGVVARIFFNDQEKRVIIIWVRDHGDRVESGLLHHETYLIQRTLAGDGSAFAELVSPYLQILHRTIHSILPNRADADDAMQEAMFKAALHLKRFHSGSDFKPWLYRIATREAFKCLRWNRRHIYSVPHSPEDGDQDHPVDRVVATHGSPAEILERKEFAATVLTALKSLNPIYRDIFVACDLRQSPVTEAAQVLGINTSTANTRLHRARLLMRKRLSGIQLP